MKPSTELRASSDPSCAPMSTASFQSRVCFVSSSSAPTPHKSQKHQVPLKTNILNHTKVLFHTKICFLPKKTIFVGFGTEISFFSPSESLSGREPTSRGGARARGRRGSQKKERTLPHAHIHVRGGLRDLSVGGGYGTHP